MHTEEPPTPRTPFHKTKAFFYLTRSLVVVAGLLVAGFGGPKACVACNHDAARSRYEDGKWGEILVEYDPHDGHPIKCFVQQGNTYHTGNPTRTIAINNRHNDGLIDDDAKMLDWPDGAKTCHRFFYPDTDDYKP